MGLGCHAGAGLFYHADFCFRQGRFGNGHITEYTDAGTKSHEIHFQIPLCFFPQLLILRDQGNRAEGRLFDHGLLFFCKSFIRCLCDIRLNLPAFGSFDAMRYRQLFAFLGIHIVFRMGIHHEFLLSFNILFILNTGNTTTSVSGCAVNTDTSLLK